MGLLLFRDGLLDELGLGLNWASARQRALAHNLANTDTPGYKRVDVLFPEALRRAANRLELARTAPGHLRPGSANGFEHRRETTTTHQNDGNNIDVELETAELVKNGLYYNAVLNRAAGYIQNLRLVISEGRR